MMKNKKLQRRSMSERELDRWNKTADYYDGEDHISAVSVKDP
jgi:hypothetical protein